MKTTTKYQDMAKDNENNNIIGEGTPVKIGLIVLFLSVFMGAFASGIWWASSINSKLDTLIASQSGAISNIEQLQSKDSSIDKEIADLKLKNALFEVSIKGIEQKMEKK